MFPELTQSVPYADAPDTAAEQRKLYRIATAQRVMIWAILSQFLILLPIGLFVVVPAVFSVIATYRLAKALQTRLAWVYTVATFVPYVGIIFLLIVNASATKYLQRAGITVGLMGASSTAIRHLDATR